MKQFSAAFIGTLKDAIVASVWYREELKRFLTASLSDPAKLASYDWKTINKRQVVNDIIDQLATDQNRNFEDFRRLTRGILEMKRYPGLEKLEDANTRIAEANRLKSDLQRLVASHNDTAEAAKKEKEYQFLKDEFERRQKEDELRQQRRQEEDTLRKENPSAYFGRILKLSGKITKDEIKQRYREMMKAYHPDLFQSLDGEFVELATRRTQQINEAFQFFAEKYGL